MMKLTLLASLLLVGLVLGQCPAKATISDLVADSLQFSISQAKANSSQNHQYTMKNPLSQTPSVAIAMQDFSISQLGSHAFYIAPSRVSKTSILFTFAWTTPIWSKVRFNFWASANPEVQLGHFSAINIPFSGIKAVAQTTIKSAFPSNANPVVRSFINGYMAKSNVVQVAVSPSNLEDKTLSIRIIVGKTTNISSIWISYIAFSPATASFTAYGGSFMKARFSRSETKDISNTIYRSPYKLLGLTQISLMHNKALQFQSSISHDFNLKVEAEGLFDSFGMMYIIAGNAPKMMCSHCGAGFVASGNVCVNTCPVGTTAKTYKDGGICCIGTATSASKKTGKTQKTIKTTGSKASGYKSYGRSGYRSTGTQTTGASRKTTTKNYGTQTRYQTRPTMTTTTQTRPTMTTTTQTRPTMTTTTQTTISRPTMTTSGQTTTTNTVNTRKSTSTSTQGSNSRQTTTASHTSPPVSEDCSENAFFNGFECVCEVGYGYMNGKCAALKIVLATPVMINMGTGSDYSNPTHTNDNQDSKKTTKEDTTKEDNTKDTQTPKEDIIPRYIPPRGNCPQNSYDNGLGTCICQTGYYFVASKCVKGTPCSAGSSRQADGSCKCNEGLTNYDGYCSRCPQGAIWSASTKSCIHVCGQNSMFDKSQNKCVCNPGYGIRGNKCENCPHGYFISKGYCVTCPRNSFLNEQTKTCECEQGFFTNQYGMCTKKCGTNQVYDVSTLQCICLNGLGRINGACTVCPSGARPTAGGQSCSQCGTNEILANGKCVCKQGYAFNTAQVCTVCNELPNGFLIRGHCSVCPRGRIYDGQGNCICPAGKMSQGSMCISQCQTDQLLDSDGNCYTCGNNQVISTGRCVCRSGYALNSCGICVLSCASNQFPFQGGCAICPLNTVYNAQINGCGCPTGYYTNHFGVCVKTELRPISCPAGQYFDKTHGCVACAGSCKTCKSATQCTSCSTAGYSPNYSGVCVAHCGDGIIIGTETCDTGNINSAGCRSCQIQTGYTCSGQPSVCRANAPNKVVPPVITTPTPTPTPTIPTPSKANLYQSGTTNINSNNVFITLKTSTTFTFSDSQESQKFIKSSFPSGPSPTVYCSQRTSPSLDTFDCLMIYPSGVPNNIFDVNFSYNYQGSRGSTTVKVDPFAALNSRSKSRAGRV